jgi:hypothetical protein
VIVFQDYDNDIKIKVTTVNTAEGYRVSNVQKV